MYNQSSSISITNSTFFGNTAAEGGGMFNKSSSPTITNSIIWGNELYGPAFVTYSNGTGYPGTGNIFTDPLFIGADNLRLSPDSPCIDAGNNDAVPVGITVDLDGNPRIVNEIVDMGAYEFQPEVPSETLRDNLENMGLPYGIEKSLTSSLDTAINSLEAFINKIQAQRGKKISEADAELLISRAQEIIAELRGGE